MRKSLNDAIAFIANKLASNAHLVHEMARRRFDWSGSAITPLRKAFDKLSNLRCQVNVAAEIATTKKAFEDLWSIC